MQISIDIGIPVGADVSGGASAITPWPLQMAALYPTMGWWDPSSTASITLNGATVAAWADQVNGYSLAQGTAGSQPTYGATLLNGRPGMGDIAGSKYLSGAAVLAALMANKGPCTFLGYVQTRAAAAFSVIASLGTVANSANLVELFAQNSNTPRYNRQGTGSATNVGALTMANATNYALASSYDGATTAKASLYVNGVAEAGNPFTNAGVCAGLDVLLVGGRRNVAVDGSFWGGLWGDIIVIPGALDPTAIAAGTSWLMSRYV